LVSLLGAARSGGADAVGVAVYGSGGFTSYPVERLQKQLAGWAEKGIGAVKMKIGRHPDEDVTRVRAARAAVGPGVALYVDANGAYTRQQALAMAERFAELEVCWFEEPVTSDDLPGLRLLRDRAPAGMEIAAGEYGYDLVYFQRMMDAGAVDVQQADASRCAGISEFLRVGALCAAAEPGIFSRSRAHGEPALRRRRPAGEGGAAPRPRATGHGVGAEAQGCRTLCRLRVPCGPAAKRRRGRGEGI